MRGYRNNGRGYSSAEIDHLASLDRPTRRGVSEDVEKQHIAAARWERSTRPTSRMCDDYDE